MGGVSELYVVGGPDAVTPAELTTLRATPAYECGGTTKTGKDLQVIEVATTGASALDTEALIDAYLSTSAPASNAGSTLPSLGAAYGSSLLDQAGGNSSPSGPETVSGTAIVVSANDWQDAAAISGLAYRYHLPVVLTSGTSLSPQAATELQALGVDQVIAVGGPSALSQGVVTAVETLKLNASPIAVLRIAGTTATETSADIALLAGTLLGWPNKTLLVAQGTPSGWSDALSAAAQSGGGEEALLLTAGQAPRCRRRSRARSYPRARRHPALVLVKAPVSRSSAARLRSRTRRRAHSRLLSTASSRETWRSMTALHPHPAAPGVPGCGCSTTRSVVRGMRF